MYVVVHGELATRERESLHKFVLYSASKPSPLKAKQNISNIRGTDVLLLYLLDERRPSVLANWLYSVLRMGRRKRIAVIGVLSGHDHSFNYSHLSENSGQRPS